MPDEFRRRKTGDSEMDAMNILAMVFADLDRAAISRILKWAEDRYVSQSSLTEGDAIKASNQFFEGIQEVARRLGSPPRAVLQAMVNVSNEIPNVPDEAEAEQAAEAE